MNEDEHQLYKNSTAVKDLKGTDIKMEEYDVLWLARELLEALSQVGRPGLAATAYLPLVSKLIVDHATTSKPHKVGLMLAPLGQALARFAGTERRPVGVEQALNSPARSASHQIFQQERI
jgi:hypothetical protein